MERNNWIKQYAIVLFIVIALYFLFNVTPPIENDFDTAFEFILRWEGEYVNDPNDPGGATKYGISSRSYPNLDIENLTVYDAKGIYYKDYWLRSGCDELTPPMDIIIFDTSVNMGVSRAKGFLNESTDWRDYLLLRLYTYSQFKQAPLYFRGWANRTLDLYKQIKEVK